VGYFFEFDEEVTKGRRVLASRPGVRCITDFFGLTGRDLSSEAIRSVAGAGTAGMRRKRTLLRQLAPIVVRQLHPNDLS